MADMKIVGSGVSGGRDDGDGDDGGRRGPRGHRGPAGPVGPAGDATPTPPFGDDTNIVIFARQTGSDTEGDGKTIATAYRTFQRAIRDVPFFVPPGYFYAVDYTGIGVETLPDNFELPSWKACHGFTPNFADPFFIVQTSVVLRAYPQLASALSAPNQVISAGVITQDPTTGIVTITDVTKTWTPGALKGLFAFGANALFQHAVIYDNTATSISITANIVPTFPVSIMEPSAELQGNVTQAGFARGAVTSIDPDSLSICGTRIVDLAGDTGMCQFGGTIWYQSCDLPLGDFNTPVRQLGFGSCNLDNCNFAGQTYINNCRIFNCGVVLLQEWFLRSADEGLSLFGGTVVDACSTIKVTETTGVDTNGFCWGGVLSMSNVLIRDSVGDAIYWPGGGATIVNSTINDASGNAFTGRGGLLALLDNVTGAGNGGVGIRSLDGAQIEITGTVTVTGSADQQVGDLAAAAYPGAPFSIYDITAVGPTGATGTGARLFRNI
jgi:hypothetical protein